MNVALRVLRVELLQLVRDKRVLFSAIVLPALLYPGLFWLMAKLESRGEAVMAERELSVLVALDELDDEVRGDFVERFETKGPSTLLQVDATPLAEADEGEPRRLAARALMGLDEALRGSDEADETLEPHDLLVIAETANGPEGQRHTAFTLWYDVTRDDSREARSRAREVVMERHCCLVDGSPGKKRL